MTLGKNFQGDEQFGFWKNYGKCSKREILNLINRKENITNFSQKNC